MFINTRSRTSKALRQDPRFLRNEYFGENKYDIASLAISNVNDPMLDIISCKNIKENDIGNLNKTVAFFSDDPDIEKYYKNPDRYLKRLAQYKYLFTPDYSLLTDMPIWMQIGNVAKSRWCGRMWQEFGLSVIPTASWSTEKSFEFVFIGLPKGTSVIVSTLGVRSNAEKRKLFLNGYEEMMKQVSPSTVYCYDKPFPEMGEEVVYINYLQATGRAS